MDEPEKKRDRSPNYPFISLPSAMGRAQAFYDEEKRGWAAIPVAAQHWNYSPKSSGLIQTIAALKAYGLMEDDGRGDARKVRLTELALRILLDNRPDSPDRGQYLHQASNSPPLAQALAERFNGAMPSEANLEHFLIFDMHFSPEAAKAAKSIVLENSEFTARFGPATMSRTPDKVEDSVNTNVATSALPLALRPPVQSIAASAAVERIIGPDGEIVLQWMGSPTWEAYDFLENYIKLRKGVLKRGPANATQDDKKEDTSKA